MQAHALVTLGWSFSRLGEGISALTQRAGLKLQDGELGDQLHAHANSALGEWVEWAAKRLGCEAAPLQTTWRGLKDELLAGGPILLRISDDCCLAILGRRGTKLRVLTPKLEERLLSVDDICRAIREPREKLRRDELEGLIKGIGIPEARQRRVLDLILDEQLGGRPFDQAWVFRVPVGAKTWRALRAVGAVQNAAALLGVHSAQYLLWVGSWAILGWLSFLGRMDRGWLLAWALLLLTLVPLQSLATWLQGAFAIGLGGFLKRRLLYGALRLTPEEMRRGGMGSFLGQAFEAEVLETLAISGGIAGLLAVVDLVVAGVVLGRFALLLALWGLLAIAVAWLFLRGFRRWTAIRMDMTQDLIECMVGNRTRLAQQRREEWHEAEDQALERYLGVSRHVDTVGAWLVAAVPRGWLLVGLAAMAPAAVAGQSSAAETAILLGGVLLAYTALRKLASSFIDVAMATVAWQRIEPLFQAATRKENSGVIAAAAPASPSQRVVEADRLTYRYRNTGNPVLKACSLGIHRGDRVLLEGPSGGGKTTFASLLCGMRTPESGLLLVNGLDRHTIGDSRWTKHVAAAPQFHENHILTETLAFNLLMGRHWPPTADDMDQAETLCRQLGLGDLLDRMPSGLLQMVGEGGWQLSHGERSRVYIARALLQRADLVILDESFAALDPESLKLAVECTFAHADTLLVIAHP